MTDDGPETSVVDLALVGGIGFELLPGGFGHGFDQLTSEEKTNSNNSLPAEGSLKKAATCWNVTGVKSIGGTDRGNGVSDVVEGNVRGGLWQGPSILVDRSDPVYLSLE